MNFSQRVKQVTAGSNMVFVESESDFPIPIGGVIVLDTSKIYRISGTVAITNKINCNGAVLLGNDRTLDKITSSLTTEIFTSDGSVIAANLTFSITGVGGKLFNILGVSGFEYVSMQDCTFANNDSLGSISGIYAVQFLNIPNQLPKGALTLNDVSRIDFRGFSTSQGHTSASILIITGTSFLIQFLGCGFGITGTQIGLDIASATITSYGVIDAGCAFNGTGIYINGTLSNLWEAEARGIDTQKDSVASASCYITSSAVTAIALVNTPVKIEGATTLQTSFRFDNGAASNRLRYLGEKGRWFTVTAVLSLISSAGNKNYIFQIYKYEDSIGAGEIDAATRIQRKQGVASDVGSITCQGEIFLSKNDYIEAWVENIDDDTDMTALFMNLSIH